MSEESKRLIDKLVAAIDQAGDEADREHDRILKEGNVRLQPITDFFVDLGRAFVPRGWRVSNDIRRSGRDVVVKWTVSAWEAPGIDFLFQARADRAQLTSAPREVIEKLQSRRTIYNGQTFGDDPLKNLIDLAKVDHMFVVITEAIEAHLVRHRPYKG